jgi:hypothetical protein
MAGGLVSYVLNRSGNNNLRDESGFIYVRNKTIPLKDRSYWRCMMKKRYNCPVTLVTSDSSMTVIKKD